MVASTQIIPASISMEEYLHTAYHPDCDFVDGVLEKRNGGEYEHSNLQAALGAWFFNRGREWGVRVLTEQRTRVGETRVRIADVCIIQRGGAIERVRVTPPLLCIEILSREDRITGTIRVLDDYLAMGVKNLWVFDPVDRVAMTYGAKGLKIAEGTRLEIAGTPIYLDCLSFLRCWIKPA
ncbi:Uma2 family endonuclease [Granulicella tundricola]|uniref:Putative restriction endonuclease domain-containing protein n=1 Tax=Granulicella tundricola (strain ATCC BAA-1859 / DSM 23138 / MP5ACTX9) TaxID=1198114 RepID=E8X059_GRATM|nr:Uma2 family endonuclease [Granulicella tundricola]ADW70040.1 protein of unknown function DUF820 [Granulicella tundricola MP5ACTX9]